MVQLVPAKNTYGACGQGEREREREAKVVCREEKMGFILTERKTTAFFQNSFFLLISNSSELYLPFDFMCDYCKRTAISTPRL